MSKIMKLTKKQEARFPEFVEKWKRIGLSTQPANRELSEKAIRGLYGLAKLKEPKIIWLPCPLSGAMSAVLYAYIRNGKSKPAKGAVGSAVGSAVDSAVDSAVYSAVHSAVGNAVGNAVHSAVGSAVYSAVGSAVDSAVDSAGRSFYGGSLWAAYPAWADYFNEVLGVSIDRNYLDLAESCGFYWLLDGVCFASERPTHINLDADGRLHSEKGQSISYSSGWGFWHHHGTQIPASWVDDKKSLTPEIALRWENVEQRRAACEIVGWANVLEHPSLNPKIIDEDLPHIGTLIQVDLPDAPEQWFLKYQCGTGRIFAESVNDKSFNTALKANAGGNGYRGVGNPEDFIPFART